MFLPLLTVFACGVGAPSGPTTTATALGECKTATAGPPYVDSGYVSAFSMSAEADGADVLLHLVDVDANCCPSPGATSSIDGSTITVEFQDVTDGDPCDCMCVYDFDVRIADVGSGDWTLDVWVNGESKGSLDLSI